MASATWSLTMNGRPRPRPGSDTGAAGRSGLTVTAPHQVVGADVTGVAIAAHLDALASLPVESVFVTHHHLDHSEAAKDFAARMGCGVRALDPAYRLGGEIPVLG